MRGKATLQRIYKLREAKGNERRREGRRKCKLIVFSYGGDMEYYPDLNPPFQTYFSAASQQAATTYSQVIGIVHSLEVKLVE